MSITPRELRDLEIKESLRGYNRDEVNDLLERAAATIEECERRIADLSERAVAAESAAGRTRETEDVLNRTLVLAQRAADEAREDATREARSLIDDAEARAARIVADAESEARARVEAERRRHDEELAALVARRDAVEAEVARLEAFAVERRAEIIGRIEADLTVLRTGTEGGTGAAPAVAPIVAAAAPPTAPSAPAPEAPMVEAAAPVPEMTAPEPAPAAPVAATLDEPSEALLVDDSEVGPPTGEVDMQSLFGDVVGSEDPTPTETIEASATALFGEVGSAEVLDDDAFFATLREAVDDAAPLGPRDEDPAPGPFDQDASESGFRDVFRRRR